MYILNALWKFVFSVVRIVTELLQTASKAGDVIMPIPNIDSLIIFFFENNEFEFDGHMYKQIKTWDQHETSMRAVPSPVVCDLRLFDILENE